MFYQSWCPICNEWSGELFDQITKAYGDDPAVVLVAIKTDGGNMSSAVDYLSDRTDASKWLVALDEGGVYLRQALGRDELYEYMWVKPNGEIGGEGKSSIYTAGSNPKEFALARTRERKQFREGTRNVIPEDLELDGSLDEAVGLAERGLLVSALGKASKASSSVPKEDLVAFRQAIASQVEKSVETHKLILEDQASENRYLSFLSLEGIAENFGASAPGKAASEAVSAHSSSSWIAAEEEAASDYASIMRRAQRADDERSQARITKALAKMAEEFPNTVYGRMAASGAKKE